MLDTKSGIKDIHKIKNETLKTNSAKSEFLEASLSLFGEAEHLLKDSNSFLKISQVLGKTSFSYFSQASAARNVFAYKRIKCVHM